MTSSSIRESVSILIKSTVSEKSKYIEHMVKNEIFSHLPMLEEEESELFEQIEKDSGFTKDRKREFLDTLKKKYLNYLELAYINDELLYELYDLLITYNQHKPSLVSTEFSILDFTCHNFLEDQDLEAFGTKLTQSLNNLFASECLATPLFWLTLNINLTFLEKRSLRHLAKYNQNLSTPFVYIKVELIYRLIERDIMSILINKSSVTHLIIEFQGRNTYNFDGLDVKQVNEEIWNGKINTFIYSLLRILEEMLPRKIVCLTLTADEDSQIFLEKENVELINKLVGHNYLKWLCLKNFNLGVSNLDLLLKSISQSKFVKVFGILESQNNRKENENICLKYKDIFSKETDMAFVVLNEEHILR